MRKILPLLFLVFCSSTAFCQLISKKESAGIDKILLDLSKNNKPKTYLIEHVSILSFEGQALVVDKSVLIENGVIRQIESNLQHPNAITIDGTGKFLMPGLTDMHVHLFDNHPMKNTWMILLLVNGVTSVRDMCGEPGKIPLREKIKNNEILGPNLYQAGPIINGVKDNTGLFAYASTPAQGREIVISQKTAGYDFIKTYAGLTKEVYEAILDEAHKQNMIVDGHLPDAVTPGDAIRMGHNSIEHLTGYIESDGHQVRVVADAAVVSETAGSSMWNCPTLYHHFMNGSREGANQMFAYAATSGLVPNGLQNTWNKMLTDNAKAIEEFVSKYATGNFGAIRDVVSNLHKAGAKLVAGTDSGNLPLMVPGYSLHQELKMMNDLGIPTYEVLRMTTINAAQAMKKESETGTVEVGKRADLLLLDANPLESIANLQRLAGVMIRGIWLSKEDLAKIKSDVSATFKK